MLGVLLREMEILVDQNIYANWSLSFRVERRLYLDAFVLTEVDIMVSLESAEDAE